MIPIIRKVLREQKIPQENELFILKQIALESYYGYSAIGYNLGGIRSFNNNGIIAGDGLSYRKFDNLYQFCDYLIALLNNRYNAFTASTDSEYISKLHGQNPSHSYYSESEKNYRKSFRNMNSLTKEYHSFIINH